MPAAGTIWESTDTTDEFSHTIFSKAISHSNKYDCKNLDTAADQIASTILNFHLDPSSGNTFDTWFKRWEDTFQHEFPSKFNVRYNCLKLNKRDVDDYVLFAGIVNHEYRKFQLKVFPVDQFKCFYFYCWFKIPKYYWHSDTVVV